jgi:hypothetical protein
MSIDSTRQAFLSLQSKGSLKIENQSSDLEYFDLSVKPMKLSLNINPLNGVIVGVFTIGMVKTKEDAERFVPRFLKQFEGLPVGPYLISHSGDAVGCIIDNSFAFPFNEKLTESLLLRDLEQQVVQATAILTSLVARGILLYPDSTSLDKYKLNVGQELFTNVLASKILLKSS